MKQNIQVPGLLSSWNPTSNQIGEKKKILSQNSSKWSCYLRDVCRLLLIEEGKQDYGKHGTVPSFLRSVATMKFYMRCSLCSILNKTWVYEISKWFFFLHFTQLELRGHHLSKKQKTNRPFLKSVVC